MPLQNRLFALTYDAFLAPAERKGMRATRAAVLRKARGRTLELGAGTGLNLAVYPAAVTSLTLTEPDEPMMQQLRRRAQHEGRDVEIVRAPGEELPFADATFDTVVCTLVLCTVSDLAATLQEIRRVLAPDGRLLVVEHVRSSEPGLARWQDRLHRPWRALARGCHCNLDTAGALRGAGFVADELSEPTWRGMLPIVRPLIAGSYAPPASSTATSR